MITVPARVKDALRDGRRLKEYLFYEITSEATMRTDANGALTGLSGDYLISVKQESSNTPSAVVSYTEGGQTVTETITPMDGDPLVYSIEIPTGTSSQSVIFKEGTTALVNKDVNVFGTGLRIGNDNLVTESVKLDERMCSGDDLKFGLCEGSSLEFQYFDKPSLTDKRIKAYVNVQYKDENGDLAWYMIPMGFFTVDKCPRQASTGIFKVTAYNKLRSTYLDAKANQQIIDYVSSRSGQESSIFGILLNLLEGFKVVVNRGDPVGASITLGADNYYYWNSDSESEWEPFDPYTIIEALKITITPDNYSSAKYYSYQIPTAALSQMISDLFYDQDYLKIFIQKTSTFITEAQALFDPNYKTTKAQTNYAELFYLTGYTNIGPTKNIYPENMTSSQVAQWCENNIQITAYSDTELYVTNVTNEPLVITIPVNVTYQEVVDTPHSWNPSASIKQSYYNQKIAPTGGITAEKIANSPIDEYVLTLADVEAFPDVTLRELQSADYEIGCMYGKLDREGDVFYGAVLNNSRLLPADNLYPANSLYPGGWSEGGFKSQYSKLWTDSQGKLTFRYLIITYKGLDANNQAKDFTLQRTVNANGNTDYYMSNNWLFKNLVWTAQEVGAYADEMVSLMQNVSWIPFEMWAAGLPYLETGDEIEISTSEGTFTSYILQRQLNGIQNLQDTYINGTLDVF